MLQIQFHTITTTAHCWFLFYLLSPRTFLAKLLSSQFLSSSPVLQVISYSPNLLQFAVIHKFAKSIQFICNFSVRPSSHTPLFWLQWHRGRLWNDLLKRRGKNIHFCSLVLRAHLLLTESNQVGTARFNPGKSNLAVSSHLHVLHPHGNGFLGDFLQQIPWQEMTDSQFPLDFFQVGEIIAFFFSFNQSTGNPWWPQPLKGDRKWPQNEAGKLPQHHTKHVLWN